MSNDTERENLLELFSTRAKESSTSRTKVAQGLERRLIEGETDKQSSRKNTGDGLSPVGNAVLREARRELGARNDQSASDDISEDQIAKAVDRVCAARAFVLDDVTRAEIIVALKQDLFGWGVLQPLIDNPEVTDIHCYDFKTVVLQRGKMSEITPLRWASHESYSTFIDRILFRLGKSLSTQQHTIDASFPDGKRICAVHKSVCGAKGPLVTIRVPRINEVSLESLVSYQVAPPLMVNYLAALTRTVEHTFIVSGETGTGKTTLMKSLGTQFRPDESIIAIEDTPELNFDHPYFRSLVSRSANTEGMGEVTLQEHIRTTLRMCPTRVILGEMRTPEAAESFLEAAQTGHCGMSTVHARNARETLTRLESLLGRAQRGVSTDIIRQQIALAVDVVVWQTREKASGRVRMAEVVEVGNFSEGNIQVRPMFKLVQQGDNPVWEVLSYSSFYDEVLERNGIYLGDAPKYIGFNFEKESDSSGVIKS
jgi:pilus assembly protein CpaF